MFHYTPHRRSPAPSFYQPPSRYDDYDARRSHFERIALAQRQQERREAEETLLRRRQQELAIEEEIERRRTVAYEAAIEQQIFEELWREEQRRAQVEREAAFVRKLRQRQAIEAEHTRKIVAQRQQQEQLRRRQEQARRQQPQQQVHAAHHRQERTEEDSTVEIDLTPLIRLSFTDHDAEEPQADTKAVTPAAEPVPEPASPPTHPTAAQGHATETLQSHYRTHLHRRQAFSTLTALAESLAEKQAAFTLPSTLTFQPSPASSTTNGHNPDFTIISKLAFQSTNAPFLAYEDFLVGLLSKIDAISSGGDRKIKQARKELVKRVDTELARLDDAREQAWAQQQQLGAQVERAEAKQEQVVAVESEQAHAEESAPVGLTPAPSAEAVASLNAESTIEDQPAQSDTAPATHVGSATPASIPPTDADAIAEPHSESAAPSDEEESDETLSVASVDAEAAIDDEVKLQAQKLGEKLVKLEQVESKASAAEQDEQALKDDFVVV